MAVAAVHAPAPLHTDAALAIPAAQVEPVHWTPLPGYWHCVVSTPSHRLAQAPWPAQAARVVPRGVPETVTHWPSIPASAQDWHCPEQRLAQQTWSVQALLAHSASDVHPWPFVFCERQAFVVGSQYCPPAHGWVAPQPPEHWVVSAHMFEAQGTAVTTVQAPARSHTEADLALPLAQLGGEH